MLLGQLADRRLADVLDLEEVDDSLDRLAVLDFLALRRSDVERLPEQAGLHAQIAAGHDVVERRHALEQRDVLEGPRDALLGRLVRFHLAAPDPLVGDGALLRMIEAVDAVQHRRLAGTVGTDDGADLALGDVKADVGQCLYATERQADVLDRQKNIRKGAHASGHLGQLAFFNAAWGARSRICTSPSMAPLRPSSNVTSTLRWAFREPS